MRKIKICIGLVFLFLLSGCEANYTLTISNQKLQEDVFLNTSLENFLEKTSTQVGIDDIADKMFTFEKDLTNFDKVFQYDSEKVGYQYKTTFNTQERSWPSVVSQCYDDIMIENDGTYLTITTSNRFLCYKKYRDLESVQINVKSNYKIVDSNADKINENGVIWNIEKEEQNDRILYLKVELQKPIVKEKGEGNILIPSIVLGLISLCILIFFLIKQRKQNNSF